MNIKKMNIFKNKKALLIFIPILIVLVLSLLFFFFLESRERTEKDLRERFLIEEIVKNFYIEYVESINNNLIWLEFIDKYTIDRAKDQMSGYALIFLDDASRGSQHLAEIITPIEVQIFSLEENYQKAEILVDFLISERIVGNEPEIVPFQHVLSLEKKNGIWFIARIAERTERFDEYLKE